MRARQAEVAHWYWTWIPLAWAIPTACLLLIALKPMIRIPGEWVALSSLRGLPAAVAQAASDRALEPVSELPWRTYQPFPYTVGAGDTLESIARHFGVDRSTLSQLNRLATSFIRPGEQLQVPNLDGFFHQVAAGESLLGIATRYQVSARVLLDVNDIRRSSLQVGETLFIPRDLKPAAEIFPSFASPFARERRSIFSVSVPLPENAGTSSVFLFPASYGESVLAAAAGKVLAVGRHPRIGRYLLVEHQNRWVSLYAHLAAVTVNSGEEVTAQQHLALVGLDHFSEQASLYFTLYHDFQPVTYRSYPPDLVRLWTQLGAVGAGPSPFGESMMLGGRRQSWVPPAG